MSTKAQNYIYVYKLNKHLIQKLQTVLNHIKNYMKYKMSRKNNKKVRVLLFAQRLLEAYFVVQARNKKRQMFST